jgi:hypothetical protein
VALSRTRQSGDPFGRLGGRRGSVTLVHVNSPDPSPPPFTLDRLAPQPPKKRRTRLIIAVAAGAVVLVVATTAAITASVVGGHPAPRQASDAQPSAAAATTAATLSPSASPAVSPTGPSMHKLGEQITRSNGYAKLTAFAYKQPVAKNAPPPEQPGYEWAAADVEVCALVDDVYVNNLAWHLVYADHTTIRASSTGYQQFPEPSYPWGDTPLPKDRCVRGWITYPAPANKRPVSIEHNPAQGSLTEWAIS